jgi:hypothetical protein
MTCHRFAAARPPFPRKTRHERTVALVLLAALLLGCGRSPSSVISGNVTYEGVPVSRGQISFAPVGGQGRVCSGPIDAGKYRVENVPAGRMIVQIIGVKQIHFARTHAEMAEAAKREHPPAAETADEVPANAQGNNQSIETAQGVQELNFDLKRPAQGDAR